MSADQWLGQSISMSAKAGENRRPGVMAAMTGGIAETANVQL
jgi:hypothetical protein